MALAWLCHEFARSNRDAPKFTGFIVDHGVREGSAIEASKVSDALSSLQIKSKILTLDWSKSPSLPDTTSFRDVANSSNFETKARAMRYHALGQACYQEGIDSILVGHHLNDQAETVLVRLCSGYTGEGLRGILPEAQIPENEALDRSPPNFQQGKYLDSYHHPRQRGDGVGAIKIIRPLLDFTKEELIDTCRDAGVEWFEDHTNANRSLTIRNTVRHLLAEDLLPKALRTERICQLAENIRAQSRRIEELSNRAFAQTKIRLKPYIGLATCEIDISQRLAPDGDDALEHHVRAAFIRRLLLLVSPTENISLHPLDPAVDLVFGPDVSSTETDAGPRQMVTCIADVEIRLHPERGATSSIRQLSLCRTKAAQIIRNRLELQIPLPERNALVQSDPLGDVLSLLSTEDISWTSWHLWDKRYWIRVGYRPHQSTSSPSPQLHDKPIKIRFLDDQTIAAASKSLKGVQMHRDSIRWAMEAVPKTTSAQTSRARLQVSLPGIFVKHADGSEQSVALPTLGWVLTGGGPKPKNWPGSKKLLDQSSEHLKSHKWFVDWRYKSVDFPRGEGHRVEGPTSWTSAGIRPKVRNSVRNPYRRVVVQ
jgi:tRNA(Ile)-lysidine synthetase-like protein